MPRIELTEEQRRQLFLSPGCVELIDDKGTLLGKYHLAADSALEDLPTEEELNRISRESPRHSVEEVMERLRKLTK